MTSTTLDDAKKECDNISSCHMFYNTEWTFIGFNACEKTASTKHSFSGSILYQMSSGNENICSINISDIHHKYIECIIDIFHVFHCI